MSSGSLVSPLLDVGGEGALGFTRPMPVLFTAARVAVARARGLGPLSSGSAAGAALGRGGGPGSSRPVDNSGMRLAGVGRAAAGAIARARAGWLRLVVSPR